jgi:hypothetical protein
MRTLAKIVATTAFAALASCATVPQQWKADLRCRAAASSQPFVQPLTVRVDRNEFQLEHGMPGFPGHTRLRGFPDPDDRLVLSGEIAPPDGKPDAARLEGRRDGRGFAAYGRVAGRNCDVVMRLE